MDLKVYYQKIRDLEQDLKAATVVVSLETPDGGAAGVRTEVPARTAAKMILDGRARPASTEEDREFQEQKAEAKRIADHIEASKRMQVTVVSESDLRALKGGKPLKQ
ncbi:MAG TPA: hypothetical protein VKE70_16895 [Candidatus Solibacter sp.]|nr:hypothetical protein [Candidatus Solibacter sp.]